MAYSRVFGWSLVVVGGLLAIRVAYLGIMYSANLSRESRQRSYVLLGLALAITLLGWWVAVLRRRR